VYFIINLIFPYIHYYHMKNIISIYTKIIDDNVSILFVRKEITIFFNLLAMMANVIFLINFLIIYAWNSFIENVRIYNSLKIWFLIKDCYATYYILIKLLYFERVFILLIIKYEFPCKIDKFHNTLIFLLKS